MAEPGTGRVHVIGSYLSPYVRKVLVCLHRKGIAYEIDPIVPFMGGREFSAMSPLRRVPVLVDDRVTLADSTVICEYLDERHPDPPLLPQGPAERARARWLEEYADTRMGEVFIWRLFNQRVIAPVVWGEATDPAVVRKALDEEIPAILGDLEAQVPEVGFLFGTPMIADVAIATFFRNAAFARFEIDAGRRGAGSRRPEPCAGARSPPGTGSRPELRSAHGPSRQLRHACLDRRRWDVVRLLRSHAPRRASAPAAVLAAGAPRERPAAGRRPLRDA